MIDFDGTNTTKYYSWSFSYPCPIFNLVGYRGGFDMSRKKILIVEDEKQLQNLLAIFLRPKGFDLVTAGDGREALQVIEGGIPDLVLLDIKLPVMDGFEFFRQLKVLVEPREIPVIMVTALKTEDAQRRARELGAVDYITKPFKANQILETVKKHLSE